MPIDRMIVVAGPKAVGKSHLMSRLEEGSLPQLADVLEMDEPHQWQCGSGLDFQDEESRERIRVTEIERFVFHYEFTAPWDPRHYARSYAEDRPLQILGNARQISFVHLWTSCDVLLSRFLDRNPRFQSKIMWLRTLYWHGTQARKLDSDFRPLYQQPDELTQIYSDWIQFCDPDKMWQHWLVDTSDEQYRFTSLTNIRSDLLKYVDQWSKERASRSGPAEQRLKEARQG